MILRAIISYSVIRITLRWVIDRSFAPIRSHTFTFGVVGHGFESHFEHFFWLARASLKSLLLFDSHGIYRRMGSTDVRALSR